MFTKADIEKLFNNAYEYSKYYVFDALTEEMIVRTEKNIGYKLPKSYIELLRLQNGGVIRNIDSWLTIIMGIGSESNTHNGLEREFFFYKEEWDYPTEIGFPFGKTQSAGHDLYYFDYKNLGLDGEPAIIRIDIELGKIFKVADNFNSFIQMILNEKEIEGELLSEFETNC